MDFVPDKVGTPIVPPGKLMAQWLPVPNRHQPWHPDHNAQPRIDAKPSFQ
jgi:hypothetical protein